MKIQKYVYLALVVVVLAYLAVLCIFPVRSNDLFLYLEIGRRYFAPEGLPKTDIFLFTGADAQFEYHHELGSMIFFYILYHLGGFNALIFAKAAFFLLMGSLPLWVARKLDDRRFSYVLPVFMLFAIYAASGRLIERGSMFSDLFSTLVLSLIIVIRAKVTGSDFYKMCIPVVFLVWVNFHAGFVVGFMLLLAWFVAEAFQYGVCDSSGKACQKDEMYSVLKTIGASIVLGLINPRGVYAYLLPLRIMVNEMLRPSVKYTYELLPPWANEFRNTPEIQVFLGVMLACFLLLAVAIGRIIKKRKYRDLPVFEIACFCVFAVLGLSMVRFVNTVSFGLAVLVAALLVNNNLLMNDEMIWTPWSRMLFPTAALAGMVLFSVTDVVKGVGSSRGKRLIGLGLDQSNKPERACDFIENNGINVNIFNHDEFGGYIIWRWQGKTKVFIHGFVNDQEYFVKNYLGIDQPGKDFNRIVRTYNIGAFLVKTLFLSGANGPDYYRKLLSSPDWHLVYMDPVAMLFVKDIPENREVIKKYSSRVSKH